MTALLLDRPTSEPDPKRRGDIPPLDRKQWCVKATPEDAQLFQMLADEEGISVPELLRRAAYLYFVVKQASS